MEMSGGEVIAALLETEGVDLVFGIIDDTEAALNATLNATLKKHGMRLVTPPHETIKVDLTETTFGALGRSMGAHGEGGNDLGEISAALKRCKRAQRCAVIHVDGDRGKHMWAPSLRGFEGMQQEPKGR